MPRRRVRGGAARSPVDVVHEVEPQRVGEGPQLLAARMPIGRSQTRCVLGAAHGESLRRSAARGTFGAQELCADNVPDYCAPMTTVDLAARLRRNPEYRRLATLPRRRHGDRALRPLGSPMVTAGRGGRPGWWAWCRGWGPWSNDPGGLLADGASRGYDCSRSDRDAGAECHRGPRPGESGRARRPGFR